jgi:hypothetical protein
MTAKTGNYIVAGLSAVWGVVCVQRIGYTFDAAFAAAIGGGVIGLAVALMTRRKA